MGQALFLAVREFLPQGAVSDSINQSSYKNLKLSNYVLFIYFTKIISGSINYQQILPGFIPFYTHCWMEVLYIYIHVPLLQTMSQNDNIAALFSINFQ